MVCCCACVRTPTPSAISVASPIPAEVSTDPDGGPSFYPPRTYMPELPWQPSGGPPCSEQTWDRNPLHLYLEPKPTDHPISNSILPQHRSDSVHHPSTDHTARAVQQDHNGSRHSIPTLPRHNVHPDVDQVGFWFSNPIWSNVHSCNNSQ
ncbi:hypothetical protein BU16DRAFT_294434 [Lophium mytilinum]|uniref:Uncharacterized protein n=1 Tax=Lophium mytilinum TaxID=390894 RepID=A0A6A6R2E5_9PEZI|nr:hypothetical protein BU16DRAFT_294434 [Lophium mytilinum]